MSQIPFIDLQAQRARIGAAMDEAILRVVHHGKYIMGPEVAELEAGLAEFCGAKHAISCSSGTDALIMPLMAWGIGPGDAVFLPSFTFAATAEVVVLLGATPVFVDVQRNTFNMDVENLQAAIGLAKDQGLKPRVVIPVGMFGLPADFDQITATAEAENLLVLDDAAQSYGASYKGKSVGTLGHVTATSFFPAKPLGCYGDGGALFTDDDDLADVLRSIRVHGKGSHKYDNARIGLNARLDTIQAAVLIQKLEIYADELKARQRVADRYNSALGDVAQVPTLPNGLTSAWAQYTIVVEDRPTLQTRLSDAGVPNVVYYPMPLHQQTAYKDMPTAPGGNPNADWLADHVLSLPMHPYLDEDTQDRICEAALA